MPGSVTVKSRLNLKIDHDLKEWAMFYAKKRGTTVTDLITNYFAFLREEEQRQDREVVPQV
jgi:hypothetical protein